jgi:hypothetical protein
MAHGIAQNVCVLKRLIDVLLRLWRLRPKEKPHLTAEGSWESVGLFLVPRGSATQKGRNVAKIGILFLGRTLLDDVSSQTHNSGRKELAGIHQQGTK